MALVPSTSYTDPNVATPSSASRALVHTYSPEEFYEQDYKEGDLGTESIDPARADLILRGVRENARLLGFFPENVRHRGHRESHKFALVTQWVLSVCSKTYAALRPYNVSAKAAERALYPTDDEISQVQQVWAQTKFIEWQLLKDGDVYWF